MAITARLILQGHVDGALAESQPITAQWALDSGTGYSVSTVTMVSGDNTISIPPSTRLIIMLPPANVQFAKTAKGNAADVGTPLDRYLPMVRPFSTGTLIINSAGLEISPHRFIFFG